MRQPLVLGDDIAQLTERLTVTGGARGKKEFETTEQYEARQKEAVSKLQRAFVFVLTSDDPRGMTSLAYDADTAEMTVKLYGEPLLGGKDAPSNQGNIFVSKRTREREVHTLARMLSG
jgi:hypothetical protein